jgi:hypothetical protein
MRIDAKHLRLWEREEAWEARARTRETRASRADMALRRGGSLAVELVMIENELLGFLLGVEIEILGGDKVKSEGLQLQRSIFFFFFFSAFGFEFLL